MTSNVPAKLKSADISRFAMRAAQLEKFKQPVVAYWCEYYIIQQILSKGLHQADQECLLYTTTLMDKLEQTKNELASEESITDEITAQAYCEQFAMETFRRADNAVRANKATIHTADTFRAAATFLDMLANWGAPTQEIMAKSKFAKYHAIRIAKALKAGEDPNLSNPVQDSTPAVSPAALDPNDPEVQRINGPSLQSYVESAPGSSAHPSPAISASRISPPPPVLPSAPTDYSQRAPSPPQYMSHRDVSPISPPSTSRQGSVSSIGGGYFPRVNDVPTFTADAAALKLPTAPLMEDDHITLPYDQPAPTANPQDFYQNQSCDMGQNKLEFPAPQPHITPQQPPQNMFQHQQHFAPPQPPQQPQFQPQQPQIFNQQLAPVPVQQSAPYQQEQTYRGTTSYKIDEEAIIAAQKHAKWAVSALNFEDVDTAVKELRIALRALGAS